MSNGNEKILTEIQDRIDKIEKSQPGFAKRAIPILSAIIAFLALVGTVWTSIVANTQTEQLLEVQRIHNRLSVLPEISFHHQGPLLEAIEAETEIYIKMKSGGIGPALIKKLDLYVLNADEELEPVGEWLEVLNNLAINKSYVFYRAIDTHFLRPGEEETLLWVDKNLLAKSIACGPAKNAYQPYEGTQHCADRYAEARRHIAYAMKRMKLVITYASVYGEEKQAEWFFGPSN